MDAIAAPDSTVLSMAHTCIVATVGPSSQHPETLKAMVAAGADVFRVNCSHLSTRAPVDTIATIRNATPHVGVLVDIQGPKLRTGANSLDLVTGQRLLLAPGDLSFDPAALGVQPGEEILLGDGTLRLRVVELRSDAMTVDVLVGGLCGPRRGVNLPETVLTPTGGLLSDKDRADIIAARDAGTDWLALSFVGSADDVLEAREHSGNMRVIAKIERRQALDRLEEIGDAADGLMAARGDLGVETPFAEVPRVQARIAQWGLRSGKVTICATEMLESMRTNTRPTRAEVSDVAGAITQGYGAVMLSAETATGHDPVNTIAAMRSICEANATIVGHKTYADLHAEHAAVAAATSALATRTGVRWILALTYTGYSAEILSACRPPAGIIAATPEVATARRLQLCHGVTPLIVTRSNDIDDSVMRASHAAIDQGLITSGERIVVCASRGNPGTSSDTIWLHQA